MTNYYAKAFQYETSEGELESLRKMWPRSANDLGKISTDYTRGVICEGGRVVDNNHGKGYEWADAVRRAEKMSN